MEFIQFFVLHGDEVLRLTGEHLVLVGLSTGGAVLIGIPLGVGLARNPRWRRPVLGLVNVIQTIPSLALFAILIPLPVIGGIGAGTALIALVLYSLLPVVSNTVAGLTGIDPAVKEAAVAMGMTNQQLLWRVGLPLGLGGILTGVRPATGIGGGLGTLAAAIGAGGVGMFLFRRVGGGGAPLLPAGA